LGNSKVTTGREQLGMTGDLKAVKETEESILGNLKVTTGSTVNLRGEMKAVNCVSDFRSAAGSSCALDEGSSPL
jgi:hypothetical protein